jgi:alpha-1,6-mannosyltransferase
VSAAATPSRAEPAARSPLASLAAGVVVAGLVLAAVLLAWRTGSPLVPRAGGARDGSTAWSFLALLVGAFVAYLAGLALLRARDVPRATVAAGVVAAVVQLAPLAGPLLFSTDAWTYWGYGWIAHAGGDPYVSPPAAFPGSPALPWLGADWRDTTSVYGPAFTLASEPVAAVVGASQDAAAWVFRVIAGLCGVACALAAGGLARRRRALAIAFVGWNPVVAVHLAGGGHNDAWVAALLVGALLLAARRRLDAAGAAWSLAILVKWVPLLFLLLRGLEARATGRPVRHVGFAGVTVAVLAVATWRYGLDWARAVAPLAANAERSTSYALPSRLESAGLPHALALAIAGVVLAAGLLLLARAALRGRAYLARAACLLLVTTPYLAVWYLAWPVALAASDEDDRLGRLGVLALSAYLLPQTIPL